MTTSYEYPSLIYCKWNLEMDPEMVSASVSPGVYTGLKQEKVFPFIILLYHGFSRFF